MRSGIALYIAGWLLWGCSKPDNTGFDLDQVAGNEEVARYMQGFEGRGDLSDNSSPTPASQAVAAFRVPQDLVIDLVLSEPKVNQPLELTFDHRGRLWVVQYNQYPYPEGLKVTGVDNHLRVSFDKIPEPPPEGVTGADKITFFEDTNGDGIYDKSTDAITGLNIATGIALGRGKIWVLNPPYLLAYPDQDDDGLPDGPPEVHLTGFGLEDTHAVVNSLRWGPDGWLYGATGSTVTSNISSSVTKNLKFEGQGIWRYHPETEIFELFAEGGGNTFHVEIDAKGRIYSGDNGAQTRGQYYKQGAYYQKNWGKHGPLTNPHAFGHLENMQLEGDALRFTHAWVKYEGDQLPSSYNGAMIAINPLLNYLQLSSLVPNGSTFKTVDLERIVETEDHWFRPVDIKVGPDGAVYLADWYDSRLTHIDPIDNWHKSSGRIYRIRGKHFQPAASFDLSKQPGEQLIQLLSHSNKWFRQQANIELGNRKDVRLIAPLRALLKDGSGQLALEALWALHVSGYFDYEVAITGLQHEDPYVRMWTVRLLGDTGTVPVKIQETLYNMTAKEIHPEVLSQIACTAKRLPVGQAVPLITALIKKPGLANDPDNPMLLWWAIEAKVKEDKNGVLDMLQDTGLWHFPVMTGVVLERLSQKLIMLDTEDGYVNCSRLLSLVPDEQYIKPVLDGIQEGLRGKGLQKLPDYLSETIKPYLDHYGEAPLSFSIQQKDSKAINSALVIISDDKADLTERLAYIKLMGELQIEPSKPVLLAMIHNQDQRVSIRQASLVALANFPDEAIGGEVAAAYPDKLRSDPVLRLAALNLLASRVNWAQELINLIKGKKKVAPDDVPLQVVLQLKMLGNEQIITAAGSIWPESASVSSEQKLAVMKRIGQVMNSGTIDLINGKQVYQRLCGSCHKLFDEGGSLGPDLTGYDRDNLKYLITNIVDPNADIREGFVNYKVTTVDQRTMTGTIANRSSELVVLRSFNGEEMIIPVERIEQIEAQPISLMPERLVDHLSDQELRSLFGYLMKDYDEIN